MAGLLDQYLASGDGGSAPITGTASVDAGLLARLLAQFRQGGGAPALPPSTNEPTSREPEVFQGDIPLPRPRPQSANNVAPAVTDTDISGAARMPMPVNPAAVAAPTTAAPAQGGVGNILGNLFRPENAPLLLSLAGGFAGAPSLGTGMRRAFSGAVAPAMQANQQNLQISTARTLYQALMSQGVAPQEALAAALNPEAFKAIAPRVYGKTPEWKQIRTDPNTGIAEYGFVDPYTQTILPGGAVTKPQVSKFEDALRLPKGTHFIDPNGIERVR